MRRFNREAGKEEFKWLGPFYNYQFNYSIDAAMEGNQTRKV